MQFRSREAHSQKRGRCEPTMPDTTVPTCTPMRAFSDRPSSPRKRDMAACTITQRREAARAGRETR